MKHIYLVRHAQSQSNVDLLKLQTTPNPNIALTHTGLKQATETGLFLSKELKGEAVVWNSPYLRTRQTAYQIIQEFKNPGLSFHYTEKENIYLAERQFGLVDDVSEYHKNYTNEARHYSLHSQHNSNFFARPPLGESPFDMALRVDSFMKLYIETSKKDNHIIVSHGAALRGILMMTLGWSFEDYTVEPNPNNASVRLLTFDEDSGWTDKGYIFKPSEVSQ